MTMAGGKEPTCAVDNLGACGAPQLSFSSREAICEQGSLSVLLVVIFFGTIFAFKQILYRERKRRLADASNGKSKIQGIMKDTQQDGSIFERFGHAVEEVVIKPFIPTSLESLITTVYICWFSFTITMGVTRFYEKRWSNDVFAQHGMFNFLSWAMGCATIDMKTVPYPPMPEVDSSNRKDGILSTVFAAMKGKKISGDNAAHALEKGHVEMLDRYFTMHLAVGSLWLTVGFVQVVLARTGWSVSVFFRNIFLI